jgi:hypothetical protein
MQAVYGFLIDPILLHIEVTLNNFRWDVPPTKIEFKHPKLGPHFVGQPLIATAIRSFFSQFYEPRRTFRCGPYILVPQGSPIDSKISELSRRGFGGPRAARALILCKNDVEQAATFLTTGALSKFAVIDLPLPYAQCPLLHFVLELCDAFLDLSDHCCICRTPVPPGVKPSICDSELCRVQLTNIGIGNTVIQEICRDPFSADLMLSIFSAAVGTDFLVPAPPVLNEKDEIPQILAKLPSMAQLMRVAQNDQQLNKVIGPAAMSLLRWVLLSNRSHLIHLPERLRLPEFPGGHQFMTLLSSQDAEDVFNTLKSQFDSFYLWHGSHGQRWHAILRTGLKNATGTKLQANGSVLGEGIYFAKDSAVSWRYSHPAPNLYANSALGKSLHIISLCEVVKLPATPINVRLPGREVEVSGCLKDHERAHTLTMEEACIVRFVMVGGQFQRDVVAQPLKAVPTLRDILEYLALSAK